MNALIVGGTKGLGKAISDSLLRAGYETFRVGRSQPNVLDLDHTPPCEVVVIAQRYRGIEDSWAGELKDSLSLTKTIFEWVEKTPLRRTSVIVLSSSLGKLVGLNQPVSYHVAKAALEQMVRYYAVKLGPQGIRVNAVAPGRIVSHANGLTPLFEEICPLGRLGTADDVANLAMFLAGEQSSYLTGQILVLDGGMSCLGQEAAAVAGYKALEQVVLK